MLINQFLILPQCINSNNFQILIAYLYILQPKGKYFYLFDVRMVNQIKYDEDYESENKREGEYVEYINYTATRNSATNR